MKLVAVAFLGILLLQATAGASRQQTSKASIEGVVLRAGTGQPVSGARVTVTPQGRDQQFRPAPVSKPVPSDSTSATVTDEKGKFSFPALDGGAYSIRIEANGYVAQNYGQRLTDGPGTPILLVAGQAAKDLAVSLTPAGNISGRIRDSFDQPVINVPVKLLRYSYNGYGQRTYQPVGSVKTNDRGEYRFYWVTPGSRYYVMAGRSSGAADAFLAMMTAAIGISGANGNEVPAPLGYAFYPGVTDISAARALELQPGTDLEAIDLTLPSKPRTYRARGRVIDSRTGQAPPYANIVISTRTPGATPLIQGISGMPNHYYNAGTGTIEIRDLLPGVYSVTAATPDRPPTGGGAPPSGPAFGMTAVTVSDSDVDGVVVTVSPGVPILGRLRVDGELPSSLTIDRLRIQLEPVNSDNGPASQVSGEFGLPAAVAADGTFRFNSVSPGEYRVRLLSGGTVYLKEVRFDGVDVLNGPLSLSRSGTLDVVIGTSSSQVSGVVAGARSQPAPATQVVLIPERARDRTDIYKTTFTDENGRFTFSGIVPGDYKVFSWETVERYAWFDPEFLAPFEARGRSVHVSESSREAIEVKLIPSGGTP